MRTWALQAKHVEVEVDINLDPNAHLNKPAAVKEESPLQPGVPDMQVLQERERGHRGRPWRVFWQGGVGGVDTPATGCHADTFAALASYRFLLPN